MKEYKELREKLYEVFDWWEEYTCDEDVKDFYNHLKCVLENTRRFKLYRYMPISVHNLINIENQKIFISKNGSFNDIYEGLPSDDLRKVSAKEMTHLNELAYITCFSEKNNNILMWSHYADSHRGFCIEYDLKFLELDNEVLHHIYPVLYYNRRNNSIKISEIAKSIETLNSCIFNNEVYEDDTGKLITLLATKGNTWIYEKEWRIIYTKKELYDKTDNNYIAKSQQLLDFPCISAIYLGYRIEPNIKDYILKIAKRLSKSTHRKIKVYESCLSNEKYQIEFKKIN